MSLFEYWEQIHACVVRSHWRSYGETILDVAAPVLVHCESEPMVGYHKDQVRNKIKLS